MTHDNFHALRVTYVNLVAGLGIDAKTMQEMARHKSPDLTLNVYAKRHDETMRTTVEALGGVLSKAEHDAPGGQKGAKRDRMKRAAGGENQTYPEDAAHDVPRLEVVPRFNRTAESLSEIVSVLSAQGSIRISQTSIPKHVTKCPLECADILSRHSSHA